MSASDLGALASAIIAIIALFYSWRSNTKRFELTEQYRNNLLEWYSDTTKVLIRLRLAIEKDCASANDKCELLSVLSSQIELGRFYFPNVDKGDFYGKHKPCAYQGYRHMALEFLVFSYNIFERQDAKQYLSHAAELQRHFTSYVFELLKPAKYNKLIGKHTTVVLNDNLTLERFLEKEPKDFIFYS